MPVLCLTKKQADQKVKVGGQDTTVGALMSDFAAGIGNAPVAVQENSDGSFTMGVLADFGGGGFITFGFL